jgi:hypothetical protein
VIRAFVSSGNGWAGCDESELERVLLLFRDARDQKVGDL